ncbi:acid ceramidase-like isoform X1 [Tubulanus polymorphus]|uniref:acid ceramidase-like isoform X1 n=1 Tax=Tubulanus polymorphus TaxID=672921 RepID=UPI003DA4E042
MNKIGVFYGVFLFVCVFHTLTVSQVPPYVEKCETGLYPPPAKHAVASHIVNLDLAPAERWRETLKDKTPMLKNLIAKFKEFIIDFSGGSHFLIDLVDKDFVVLVDTLPSPFKEEIKGIANITGIPLGEVVLYNVFYEIFTVCTSIIAQDSKGVMYHARNLDFGLFLGWKNHSWVITKALRPALVQLDFQSKGKTVFKSVNFAGYIGVLTGMKPGVFTLTMNERFNADGGYIGILKWILGDRKSVWMGFLTRMVLETASSFEEARFRLANTPMLAPAYFIVGGNQSYQGCVITRARDKALDVWCMNKTDFYILETNYDHWEKPFILDDRRTPAHNCMNKLTAKGVGIPGLFNVLSSKPVLNKLTTYTALMQVNSGHIETYLQYCPEPCFPW